MRAIRPVLSLPSALLLALALAAPVLAQPPAAAPAPAPPPPDWTMPTVPWRAQPRPFEGFAHGPDRMDDCGGYTWRSVSLSS